MTNEKMQIRHGREMTNLKGHNSTCSTMGLTNCKQGAEIQLCKTTKKRWSHLDSTKNPFRLLFSKIVHQRSEANILDNHKVNNH